MKWTLGTILVGVAALLAGGCSSTYSHGEVYYVDGEIPFNSTFEDVRGVKSSRVLRCEARDVERFVNDLFSDNVEPKVAPPQSARGAVLLSIRTDDTSTGGVFECEESIDGRSGEIGMVYRFRRFESNDDKDVFLIGTWTHWTASRVEYWNRMIDSSRPIDD
jgi:hypothetical protein